MNTVAGRKLYITERGWFAVDSKGHPLFTGCRFAVLGVIGARVGYDVPTARQPQGADNIVHDLQVAGDNTPGDGSTMRQGQKAVRVVYGADAPLLFGALSDDEFHAAVRKGATVGFAVQCGKLPRALRNFVGFGYTGGHYMSVDGSYDDGTDDLFDPMYRPASQAQPRRVQFGDFANAMERDGKGNIIVSLGFENAAFYRQELAAAQASLAPLTEQIAQAQAVVTDLQAKIAAQVIA